MNIEQKTIQTIRTLSIDAIQKAASGHPGAPMGMAPAAYSLWRHQLKFNPDNPFWPNRDRFILSAGHASMLLYSLLHVTRIKDPGRDDSPYSITLDDIKTFRQLNSRCPGHPEFGDAAGIETTTGPLGQGLAVSVGTAMAEKWLEAQYNTDDFPIIDYNTYALCGDGCMMEGVSHEAAALAGHLKLGNLCWIYDSNRITIEGSTDKSMTENVAKRFLAYGWAVLTVTDGNDLKALKQVMEDVIAIDDRPCLVIVHSHIAYGSPNKQDTASSHGSPLGEDEIKLTKRAYGWPEDEKFLVPEDVYEHMNEAFADKNRIAEAAWNEIFSVYSEKNPDKAAELTHIFNGTLPENWDTKLPDFGDETSIATRSASGKVLNAIASEIPWFIGGSADLAPSNNTFLKDKEIFSASNYSGSNISFGIREFAMSAICNGMANAGLRPFSATFMVFSDYARPAIRLSALMQLPIIYVFTHDSISVGEDGPTHQPVEHLAALRAMPGLTVIRPADAAEVCAAYQYALADSKQPIIMALSRQSLPVIDRDKYANAIGTQQGAYVLADNSTANDPDIIIIATGSEVRHAMEAYETLSSEDVKIRIVSMPSWELYEAQSGEYRQSVLPSEVTRRIVIEQGVSQGWHKYSGQEGVLMTIDSFGISAPGPIAEEHFGFTASDLIQAAKELLS